MTTVPRVPVPPYGQAALTELMPSLLAALGVPDSLNALGLPPAPRACVLIVDGLGWELLRGHPAEAPFLHSLPGRPITAGFPSTTVTSLGSIGTGRPPGSHGLLGYQIAIPGRGRLLNCLRWKDEVDPLRFQPVPTMYERASAAGIAVSHVASRHYDGTSLTRAVWRGARYVPADSLGQLLAGAERAVRDGDQALVTVYHPDLDFTGHHSGYDTPAWRYQLSFVDTLAERLASVLPPDTAMYVTADHGMLDPAERLDVDAHPELREGVALLGGEARARHLYTEPGAAEDVLAAWRERLDGAAWVLPREEAVAGGWFGPVAEEMLPRIGDVLAVPYGELAIIASRAEPLETRLIGMHGSLTPAEQNVPLLIRTVA